MIKNRREVTLANKEAIICLWDMERRVKCMLRFAMRDLRRGYLFGVVCSADNRSNFL